MQSRSLGKQGLKVSVLGLGCMGMSEYYGELDNTESLATLDRAWDLGINFYDTANIYGMGENEKLISKFVQKHRNEIVVATKFGIVRDPNNPDARGINSRPEYVIKCCEESLKRLGIETIDLYYQHRVDLNTPIEDTIGAMIKLKEQGKIKYLGLSEASAEIIRRAHNVHPISALQSEYSLWCRDIEANNVLETCRELNIGLVPYSPIGRGFLTGTITNLQQLDANDFRRNLPRFQDENFQHNFKIVEIVQNLAKEKNCTAAQLALAWIIAQGDDMVPIPGTKRRKYLDENVACLDVHLTHDEVNQLNALLPPDMAKGSRYTAEAMKAYKFDTKDNG